jgi:TetR/AcrR family transcriptional repressor of nem operon
MRKGEATRERIIVRAAEIFNTRGFAGTALGDIMQATGLEKGGIYRHFASKEELALAAFDYALAQVRSRIQAGIAGKSHAADVLHGFIDVFRSYAEHPPLIGGCPVLNTATEADDTHPILRERARAALAEWRTLIRTTVIGGQARGELRPEVAPDAVALVLIAALEGAVMLGGLLHEHAPFQVVADHLDAYVETLRSAGCVGTELA